jgi:hypothetical protein
MNDWPLGPENSRLTFEWELPSLAEQSGQLDPQSLVAQSVGVLIGSPLLIAGKLPWLGKLA